MKEVEFINSRVQEGRSQPSTGDYPPMNGTSDASKSTGVSRWLTHHERTSVIAVLRSFTDTLAIYRSMLNNRLRHESLNGPQHQKDSDRNERLMKIREESFYVSDFFENLIKELDTNGSFNLLIREIEDKRKRHDDEVAIVRDYEQVRKTVTELRKRMLTERNVHARDKEELKAQLARFKNENKVSELKAGIETKYVRAWEKARCEGIYLRWGVALNSLQDELGNLSLEEQNECRIAVAIEAFLEQNVTANEIAASQWQKRYGREMQMYERENGRLNDEIENRRQVLEKRQIEYRERQEFIERYLEEKRSVQEQKKHEEYRERCAISIQAWWRGVMVRRKLGPYRPEEKKKKRAVKSKK